MTSRTTGLAADEVRRHNRSAVLRLLHRRGAMGRSELTRATGLNRSTVADLVRELADLGLVAEGPAEIRGPGRPSPTVTIVPDSHPVLAIAISVYSTTIAVVGLGGEIFGRVVRRAEPGESAEALVSAVLESATPLLAANQPRAVGVSVTGVCRRSDGFLHTAPNLGWCDVPLGNLFRDALGLAVTVGNDADVGALAEFVRGAGRGADDLFYVSGEAGIGGGIIARGLPFGGSSGYAGEVGHMTMNPTGRRCGCGAVGCWETEAGEDALFRATGIDPAGDGLSAHADIRARAEAGDAQVLVGLSIVGRWLGLGIGDIVNIFNPEVVVVGGFFQDLWPWLDQHVEGGFEERAMAPPKAGARIAPSELGADVGVLGAAELALQPLLDDPTAVQA